MSLRKAGQLTFPDYSGVRCLMMPYIQGDAASVPSEYAAYDTIINSVFIKRGDVGFLTIDESPAVKGIPHRGQRAKYGRAIHTEAGKHPDRSLRWGGTWGSADYVIIDRDATVLLANSLDDTCAIWDASHEDTSRDGDIGHFSESYPYDRAILMKAGDVYEIGILTPHESLPLKADCRRQFLRILSSGVHGREPYFTENPLMRDRCG